MEGAGRGPQKESGGCCSKAEKPPVLRRLVPQQLRGSFPQARQESLSQGWVAGRCSKGTRLRWRRWRRPNRQGSRVERRRQLQQAATCGAQRREQPWRRRRPQPGPRRGSGAEAGSRLRWKPGLSAAGGSVAGASGRPRPRLPPSPVFLFLSLIYREVQITLMDSFLRLILRSRVQFSEDGAWRSELTWRTHFVSIMPGTPSQGDVSGCHSPLS
ncbi:uncharacterized protein LOC141575548 [Camelus bactrianus]|uniref:Uncharacterized protein LOC141575548 n=1 Tax=Camelus bactrianus TaxID=9837 RepID=A0AC58PM28_CAMBA